MIMKSSLPRPYCRFVLISVRNVSKQSEVECEGDASRQMGEAHNAVSTELAIKKHMHRVSSQLLICQRMHKIHPLPPKAIPQCPARDPLLSVIEDII